MSEGIKSSIISPSGSTSLALPATLSTLKLWMDASDPALFTQDSSNNVITWFDKGPMKLTASQSTSGDQPAWAANVQNGLAGVHFSSTSHILDLGATPIVNSTQGFTIFIVANLTAFYNSNTFPMMLVVNSDETQILKFGLSNDTSGPYNDVFFGAEASWTTGRATGFGFSTGTPYRFTFTYNGAAPGTQSNFGIYVNGVAQTVQNTSTFSSETGDSYIGSDGAGDPFKGYIHEIVAFESLLPNVQRTAMDSYLSSKWGI